MKIWLINIGVESLQREFHSLYDFLVGIFLIYYTFYLKNSKQSVYLPVLIQLLLNLFNKVNLL